jgi:hypothetical protein
MLRICRMFIATLGLICVNAGSASADMCFRYGSGGTLVAKGATLPAANTCVPLAFFEDGALQGAATGSICTAADGSTVIFHYTYDGCISPYFESGVCRLQLGPQIGPPVPARSIAARIHLGLPTIQSSCFGTYSQPGSTSPNNTAQLSYCDGPPVPTAFTCGPPL